MPDLWGKLSEVEVGIGDRRLALRARAGCYCPPFLSFLGAGGVAVILRVVVWVRVVVGGMWL